MALNFTHLAALPSNSESGRFLAETNNVSDSSRRSDDNTVRVDPLDDLKKYRGGYDITNKHYWSVSIHGYIIAVIWVLCGVGYGVFLLVKSTFMSSRKLKKKKRSPCHKQCYVQPLVFAILFTLLAITGSGLVLGGNAKFHSRAKTVIDIIIDTADEASDTIHNTTGAMKEMSLSLGDVDATSQATSFLTSTSRRLDAQAADIERQASTNRRRIDLGLRIVYNNNGYDFIDVSSCNCSTSFAGDTCTALESFQQDPYNNSLSSILPCDELRSAKSVLGDVSAGIYDLVNEVNTNISTSYGNIVQICNPFSPPPTHEYQPWNCPSTSIRIGDIPQVLRMLACPDSEGTTCNGGILISATYYNTVEAYSTSIQRLLDVYPGMESLVECETVKDAFLEILQKHCSPLKRYVRMVWAALVFLAVVMVALVVVWTVTVHHNKNHHSLLDGSVKPHSTTSTEDMLESGMAKTTNGDSKQTLDI
ncbi:hypothetical protein DH2020_049477 [Rehmannia glutinosa]|uniref:Transmembrane protein n=1 Tax=Rehmannia glutinosa TaxID=99300 RepID=A0ABR0U326_REHGL